jgi:hypothetical protein
MFKGHVNFKGNFADACLRATSIRHWKGRMWMWHPDSGEQTWSHRKITWLVKVQWEVMQRFTYGDQSEQWGKTEYVTQFHSASCSSRHSTTKSSWLNLRGTCYFYFIGDQAEDLRDSIFWPTLTQVLVAPKVVPTLCEQWFLNASLLVCLCKFFLDYISCCP